MPETSRRSGATWLPLEAGLVALAVLVAATAGCARVGGDVSAGMTPRAGQPATIPAMGEVVAAEIPLAPNKEAWTLPYGDVVSSSISPDGEYTVLSLTSGGPRQVIPGLQVIDKQGRMLWERRFTEKPYRFGRAWPLGGGRYVGAIVIDHAEKGLFYLFDRDGNLLWKPLELAGFVTPYMAPQGSTLLLSDERGHLHLLSLEGETIVDIPVSDKVTARFSDDGGHLIVLDDRRIFIVDEKGQMWRFRAEVDDPSDIQVSPDGEFIAITTGGGDGRLEMLRRDGQMQWSYDGDRGSADRLAFSSDGKYLALYNFGTRGGIAVFNAVDGTVLWRSYFSPPDDRRAFVRQVVVRPGSGELIALYVESYQTGRQTAEESRLIVFDEKGHPKWSAPVGVDIDLEFGRDGAQAAMTTNVAAGSAGPAKNKLIWYDLLGLYQAARPAP